MNDAFEQYDGIPCTARLGRPPQEASAGDASESAAIRRRVPATGEDATGLEPVRALRSGRWSRGRQTDSYTKPGLRSSERRAKRSRNRSRTGTRANRRGGVNGETQALL
ncbi:hypothetical protein ACGFY8_34515 [Streptomyces sp. NPDC048232]|uniref:hypothetical protein n=1 Tax=Streptomyces sp. NPDC048232 TaxID=3365520 RepID=UPI00372002EC